MSDGDNEIKLKVHKYRGILKRSFKSVAEAEKAIEAYSEKYSNMIFEIYTGDSDNLEVDLIEAEEDTLEILEDSKTKFEKEYLER